MIELLAYLGAFWLFLLSAEFRGRWIGDFRDAGAVGRGFMLLEGAVAAFCGLSPFTALALVL